MNATPRTDAEANGFPAVDADFARELERENNALRSALAALIEGRPLEEPPAIAKIAHRNWELFQQARAALDYGR